MNISFYKSTILNAEKVLKSSLIFLTATLISNIIFVGQVGAQENSREDLKLFLTTSAYGMGAGALLGVASIAFSDDPAGKVNQVARGASLGLYAGIGLGLYYVYGPKNTISKDSYSDFNYLILPSINNSKEDAVFILSKRFK